MAESSIIYCGSCAFDKVSILATKWCPNCEEGYCDDCVKAHRVNRKLRDHHIISVTDFANITSLQQNKWCSDHDKNIDFFCPAHDKIVCVKCVQMSHSACADILSIEHAAKDSKTSSFLSDIENNLSVVIGNLDKALQHQEQNVKTLGNDENGIKRKVKEFRNDINKRLDQLESECLNNVAHLRSKFTSVLDNSVHDLKGKRKQYTEMQDEISKLKRVASDLQVFFATRQMNETVYKEQESVQSMLEKVKHYELQFRPSSGMPSNKSTHSFGRLEAKQTIAPLNYNVPKSEQAQTFVPMFPNINGSNLKLRKEISINRLPGENLIITCCQILPCHTLVFGDYSSHRLIFHKESGAYDGEFSLTNYGGHVIAITCVAYAKVAVVHAYYGVSTCMTIINTDKWLIDNAFSLQNKVVGGVYFYHQQLYLDVIGADINVVDIIGKIIGTIPSEHSACVKRLEVLGNNIYYTDTINHKVVRCDIKGSKIWEHIDKRIITNACLTIDNGGNVFVAGYEANVIIMISRDGKQSKVILDASNKINRPRSIHCDRDRNLLLVCNEADGYAGLFDIVN